MFASLQQWLFDCKMFQAGASDIAFEALNWLIYLRKLHKLQLIDGSAACRGMSRIPAPCREDKALVVLILSEPTFL